MLSKTLMHSAIDYAVADREKRQEVASKRRAKVTAAKRLLQSQGYEEFTEALSKIFGAGQVETPRKGWVFHDSELSHLITEESVDAANDSELEHMHPCLIYSSFVFIEIREKDLQGRVTFIPWKWPSNGSDFAIPLMAYPTSNIHAILLALADLEGENSVCAVRVAQSAPAKEVPEQKQESLFAKAVLDVLQKHGFIGD